MKSAADRPVELGELLDFVPGRDGNYRGILFPTWALAPLVAWVEHGRDPGDFLRAVLANDLIGAVTMADDLNLPLVAAIAVFCRGRLPHDAWGSSEKVQAWAERRGLTGRRTCCGREDEAFAFGPCQSPRSRQTPSWSAWRRGSAR